jgi:bifunctional DNA-binding transcriptional regulator/antitoxin component of YhaV-PrlF toxin-antitoxin module
MSTDEVALDCKERVPIPKEFREKVGLQLGGKARLKVENGNIIIMPPNSPEEFIGELERMHPERKSDHRSSKKYGCQRRSD